jgi:hypothetical protein
MKTRQNSEPFFDDEISIADMINFFKSHKKFISMFMVLGVLLGGLFGQISGPIYKGSVLISPAKVSGTFVIDPKNMLIKLDMNSYYSKETFVNCNPGLYKRKNKDVSYDMSGIVKFSVTKDSDLIEIRMDHKSRAVINDCLTSMVEDIRKIQDEIARPLIELNKNKLMYEETRKVAFEKQRELLIDLRNEALKTNTEQRFLGVLFTNIFLLNSLEINNTRDEVMKLKAAISLEQTKSVEKFLPITIEKKSFPSPKLGALFGIFLGLFLGVLIGLIKSIKI